MNKIKAEIILQDIIDFIKSDNDVLVKKAIKGDYPIKSLHEVDRKLVLGIIELHELL